MSSAAKIWVATNAKAKNRKRLQFSEGTFRLDSLPVDCPYFQIKDHKGDMHTQKLCMGLKKDKEWIIYIGNKDCLYHFEGYQPMPFIPVLDKIYITHFYSEKYSGIVDEDRRQKSNIFQNKLDELEIHQVYDDVYSFNPLEGTEILKQLCKMDEIYSLAPFLFFGKIQSWQVIYFDSRIDILFLNEPTFQELENITKYLGIDKIEKDQLSSSNWKDYNTGAPFLIELKREILIDYTFLKKMEKLLLENENVLVLKTSTSITVTND